MQLGKSDSRSRIEADSTERAVSPVIGVILMVAITVVLAGVIGVMVFGLADDLGDTAPTASFDAEISPGSDEIEISHNGGDSIELSDLRIEVDDETLSGTDFGSDNISAGQTISYSDASTIDFEEGDEVDIVIVHDPSDSVLKDTTITA